MTKLAILNTTIATTDGTYKVQTIGLEEAKELVQCNDLDSAVGHQSTADVMTALLGVDIPMNRQMFIQQAGQQALVFKMRGRPAEGHIMSIDEIEAMGYDLKLMTRTA